ncbi:Hypothetical predicted protein, partial [Pelobates cultripes]
DTDDHSGREQGAAEHLGREQEHWISSEQAVGTLERSASECRTTAGASRSVPMVGKVATKGKAGSLAVDSAVGRNDAGRAARTGSMKDGAVSAT